MSRLWADRLSRRSFLAAAATGPLVGAGGCLVGDTDPGQRWLKLAMFLPATEFVVGRVAVVL